VAKNALGSLGNVDGLIADAFEVVVNAGDGQDKAKVNGHELVKGEKLDDAVVNFHLKLVDRVFFLEDALGEVFIGFEDSVNGLVNGAFGEAAHPEQALFHFVEIFFEVAFHEPFP
jgi:aspartate carbamoyltransferase catalytic subunit